MTQNSLDAIRFNDDGLVPAIAQDFASGKVLMLAWMNRDAVAATLSEQRAVYFSRSRQKLWRKGEESGHVQHLKDLRLDCDNDAILLSVEQVGGIACHTGRESCFYQGADDDGWRALDPIIKSSDQIYGNGEPKKS